MSKERDRDMSRISVALAQAMYHAWCWYDMVKIAKALIRVVSEYDQLEKAEQQDMCEAGTALPDITKGASIRVKSY